MTSGKDIIAFDMHKEVFRLYTIPCTKSSSLSALGFHGGDGKGMIIKYTESLVSLQGFQPQVEESKY